MHFHAWNLVDEHSREILAVAIHPIELHAQRAIRTFCRRAIETGDLSDRLVDYTARVIRDVPTAAKAFEIYTLLEGIPCTPARARSMLPNKVTGVLLVAIQPFPSTPGATSLHRPW